jgi:NTE family protein
MQVSGLLDDEVIELIDGGVHDNQGVEGLVDRSCTHMVISDGSGQMPDRQRPSTRLPAVLGRVVSIYSDAEREQRLLSALQGGDSVAFLHLQTGLPAQTRKPGQARTEVPAPLEPAEFGVHIDVQRALANVRTDLDAFCDLEAWALMGDGYRLAGQIVPSRAGVASLGKPAEVASWPFDEVAAQLGPEAPDPRFLKVLQVSRERFLKPARMRRGGLATAFALIAVVLVGAAVGLWFLLTPHGTALFIAGLATLVCLGLYFGSDKPYVRPLAIGVFDLLAPLLLAIPLLAVAGLQLVAGRLWRSAGSAVQAERPPEAVPVAEQ